MFSPKSIDYTQILAVICISCCSFASLGSAQDYDGEAETAITGLGGLGGLSGLSGLGGLSALANGVVTGYAPIGAGSDMGGSEGGLYGSGSGNSDRTYSSDSDAESGDYDEDSNDSSASEEHPILSKFISLISGGRHKRSIGDAAIKDTKIADNQPAASVEEVHSRVKRGYKGWVPYVSTYVKTDKKANFKWGVKAKVGKKYGK